MWQHYRKTFIPVQIMIVLIAVALNLYWKIPVIPLLVFVVVMEIGAVAGAAWAQRLRRKIDGGRSSLLR